MTYHPLISILVPVYNVEAFIERCAKSIFCQTYDHVEYIFIDDGCTDSSITVLEKVIDNNLGCKERCSIIRHQQNRGLAAARNTAVDACHGEFIFHVDSDDWIEPDAVASLVKKQQETDADIVYTSGYYKYQKEDEKILCHGWSSNRESVLTNILEDKATICVWSKLIRHRLYTENGIRCDERGSFYEDYQILSRLVYFSHTIACLDAYIYHYNRSNPNSLVTNLVSNIDIQRQGLQSIQSVLQFFQDKEQIYLDSVKSYYLCYIYKMLNANFRHKNKTAYSLFLSILRQTERQYWSQIGWDNPWRRIIDCHYYFRRLLYYYK